MSRQRNGWMVMRKLIGLVRPLTGYMCLAIIMGLFGHLMATYITIFGMYGILYVLGFEIGMPLFIIFICVLLFAVLRAALRYGEQTCNHYIAFTLLAIIRDKVFQALRRLCPAKLEGRDKGDLISVITSDIELLEVFYAHTISPIGIWMLFTVAMTGFISRYHIGLGILALCAYLIVGVGEPIIIAKMSGDSGMRFRTQSGNLAAFVLDQLRGLSQTLQYDCGELRLSELRQHSEELSREELQMKQMTGRNTAVTNTVILILDMMMLFSSIYLYQRGQLDFEGILICTVALFSSFGPSVALAALGSTLQNTFAAGNRVLDILEEEPVTEEIYGNEEISYEGVSVDDVSFAYRDDRILTHVSLEIKPKEIVGIMGKSGSGKSTLLKLLMRFWKVTDGSIMMSGVNLEEVNTNNLRNLESFLTQDTVLFKGTIRDNLKIAQLDASEEQIIQACKKASIHSFIEALPKGYDTPVGELGETLSGGERQRIGLARAFLHDSDLVLLDEPTSNLDSLNEAVILKSLKEGCANKTVVLVSHRQSTMGIADRSYMIENGRVSH